MTPSALAAVLRSAVSRRDLRGLSRAVRAAGPAPLVAAWGKLRPVERIAAFRALNQQSAAQVFSDLPADGKWLAYLSEVSEGAAPLLEGVRRSEAKLLRRASAGELAAMRKALS